MNSAPRRDPLARGFRCGPQGFGWNRGREHGSNISELEVSIRHDRSSRTKLLITLVDQQAVWKLGVVVCRRMIGEKLEGSRLR